MRRIAYLAATFAAVATLCVVPRSSQAQITERIVAKIPHSFIVDNKTLPPGQYTFRIVQQTNQSTMRISDADGRTVMEFLVRDSIDDHLPKHTELVFNRYGNKEFLAHIYQTGTKLGAAVVDASREEAGLKNQGQSATTHTEEQEK
ncbi:MAG: hypothetical protein KGL64_08035 [Acidobacteriota bacterium]|nr:hypothetical protein [Acidobacteriota bacterium]